MSPYSIGSLIAFVVTAVIGGVVKLVLAKRRKELEGFHGYVYKEEVQESQTDEWELL